VTGDLRTTDEVMDVPRGGAAVSTGLRARARRRGRAGRRHWLPATPSAWIVVAATAAALALRLFTFTRPGYLTGITEYDDGVYLGAAIQLASGAIPYRDFALVQPPGIVLLMTPVAMVAGMATTVKALALARVLTALASAACVPLAGRLMLRRGPVVTLVTCGFLAIYPDDVSTAHTLMLEPWMNLLCLLAASAAFRGGALAPPGPLLWAGLAMGFAAVVKFWALVPAAVLLAVCAAAWLSRRDPAGGARTRRYVAGLAAGFAVPLAPFALAAPGTLWHATIIDQAARTGTTVPVAVRLAHLTGLIDVMTVHGHLALDAGTSSIYAAGSSAPVDPGTSLAWLPYVVAAACVTLLAGGLLRRAASLGLPPSPLEWFAAVTAAIACAAIVSYSAFFYHYPDFPAPWLALTAGGAAGALARWPARTLAGAIAVALSLVGALQVAEISPMRQVTAQAIAHQIPRGSCVVTDEVSLTIAADRFTGHPASCPVIVDSLAQTLVLSSGVSVQGGAARMPSVVAAWKAWLSQADYVWLTPGHGPGGGSVRRIPWTPGLLGWFEQSFTAVGSYSWGTGQLYVRAPAAAAAAARR
jgi:hypothetical protein